MRVLVVSALLFAGACASNSGGVESDLDRKAADLLRAGEVTKARELFLKSAHAGDDHYVAWVGVAHCEARLGRAPAFENAALRASSAAPRTVRAQDRLGRLYVKAAERFRQGSRARHYAGIGVEYLRRVFAAAPTTRDLNYNLGLGLALTEDDAAARVLLTQAHREAPRRLDVAHVLVLVLRRLERPADLLGVAEAVPEESRPASWGPLLEWARAAAPGGPSVGGDEVLRR